MLPVAADCQPKPILRREVRRQYTRVPFRHYGKPSFRSWRALGGIRTRRNPSLQFRCAAIDATAAFRTAWVASKAPGFREISAATLNGRKWPTEASIIAR
jgi:hypothetical protein